jgi:hypothetical protein
MLIILEVCCAFYRKSRGPVVFHPTNGGNAIHHQLHTNQQRAAVQTERNLQGIYVNTVIRPSQPATTTLPIQDSARKRIGVQCHSAAVVHGGGMVFFFCYG